MTELRMNLVPAYTVHLELSTFIEMGVARCYQGYTGTALEISTENRVKMAPSSEKFGATPKSWELIVSDFDLLPSKIYQ